MVDKGYRHLNVSSKLQTSTKVFLTTTEKRRLEESEKLPSFMLLDSSLWFPARFHKNTFSKSLNSGRKEVTKGILEIRELKFSVWSWLDSGYTRSNSQLTKRGKVENESNQCVDALAMFRATLSFNYVNIWWRTLLSFDKAELFCNKLIRS